MISDKEREELEALRRHHQRQLEIESIKELPLEEDIDFPIRKCVAAFALLGCEPIWSCCGFDYVGQPIHKWHQYGRTFFILEHNRQTRMVLNGFVEIHGKRDEWVINFPTPDILDFHNDFVNVIPEWGYTPCFHYYEPAVFKIQNLENYLLSLKDQFLDQVVLRDTNGVYQTEYKYWQYSPRGEWLIKKSYLDHIEEH